MSALEVEFGAGIYTITHLPSESVYVGQTLNIRKRWAEHTKQLVDCTHHNESLKRLAEIFTVMKPGTGVPGQVLSTQIR